MFVGAVGIGSGHQISIQSMANVPIANIGANVDQITALYFGGCEIVRLAVPNPTDVAHLEKIKGKLRSQGIGIPIVADVHFSPKVAHDCLGVADKVRINAGNFAGGFGESQNFALNKFSKFFEAAKSAGVPVRIGVNAGSLSKRMVERHGNTAQGMWESAHECILAANCVEFYDLILSFKASDARLMVESYRLACSEMARLNLDYPLHLGITEAGNGQYGRIKSAVGIGSLLLDGIGDTIRVSITEDPINEIQVARDILQSTGLRRFSAEFVACPSCGRTNYDMQAVLEDVKERIGKLERARSLKIAVMGCIVNGLGEADNADYAIVGLPNGLVTIYGGSVCLLKGIEPELAASTLEKIILAGG